MQRVTDGFRVFWSESSGFVLNQIRKQSGAQLQLLRDEVQSTRPCDFGVKLQRIS